MLSEPKPQPLVLPVPPAVGHTARGHCKARLRTRCNGTHPDALQRLDGLWRALPLLVGMPQLAIPTFTKRVDHAVLAQHQAVVTPCRHRAHRHPCERLNHLWRPLVLVVTVAQLPRCTISKRVDLASTAHHQAVTPPRCHRAHLDALERLDDLRCRLHCSVAMPQLAIAAISKRVHLAAGAQHQAVSAACCHRAHAHAAQRLNHLGGQLPVLIAVPKLPIPSKAERVDGTAGGQHQAVPTSRRHRTGSHATQPLDDPRRAQVLLIAVAQPTSIAPAERVDGAVLAQRQCVSVGRRHAAHAHRREPRHHRRHRHHLLLSVAQQSILFPAARQQPPLRAHKRRMIAAGGDRRPALLHDRARRRRRRLAVEGAAHAVDARHVLRRCQHRHHARQHLRRQLVQLELWRGGRGALGLGRRVGAAGGSARVEELGDLVAEGETGGDFVGGELGGGAQRVGGRAEGGERGGHRGRGGVR
mmetsp:Transcript_45114/g.133313  ORF Transcript_45114/g.133313 Transcript_45114/m.133313 type:complete len:472 (-) Transcript_45114:7-1422(-)